MNIVNNAKTQRPSVCNAEKSPCPTRTSRRNSLPMIKTRLVDLRERGSCLSTPPRPAAPSHLRPPVDDFDTEYNDYILSIKVVDSIDEGHPPLASLHRHVKPSSRLERNADQFETRRQRGRLCQRLHPLHRRRRVRPRLRDGHLHPETPRPRTHGSRGTDDLEIHHPRRRRDPRIRQEHPISWNRQEPTASSAPGTWALPS